VYISVKDKTLTDILVESADTRIVNSYNNAYYRELTNENGSSYENAKAISLFLNTKVEFCRAIFLDK